MENGMTIVTTTLAAKIKKHLDTRTQFLFKHFQIPWNDEKWEFWTGGSNFIRFLPILADVTLRETLTSDKLLKSPKNQFVFIFELKNRSNFTRHHFKNLF